MFTRNSPPTILNNQSHPPTSLGRLAASQTASPRFPVAGPAMLEPSGKIGVVQEHKQGDGAVYIGKSTQIIGDISECSTLEIHGTLEGNIIADRVIIRDGGGFRGSMQTDNAEVHGVVEGTLIVHELLNVCSTGSVTGELTYGRLAVADGGAVSGTLQSKQGVFADAEAAANIVSLSTSPGRDGLAGETT